MAVPTGPLPATLGAGTALLSSVEASPLLHSKHVLGITIVLLLFALRPRAGHGGHALSGIPTAFFVLKYLFVRVPPLV